jgi:hypothetical protein
MDVPEIGRRLEAGSEVPPAERPGSAARGGSLGQLIEVNANG